MRTRFRQHTRPAGWVLLSTFVAVLSATCITNAKMTQAEKACCASMAGECGAAMSQAHRCCQNETSRPDQLLVTSRVSIATPDLLSRVAILSPPIHLATFRPVAAFDRTVARPPGVPTYVLVSSFRV